MAQVATPTEARVLGGEDSLAQRARADPAAPDTDENAARHPSPRQLRR